MIDAVWKHLIFSHFIPFECTRGLIIFIKKIIVILTTKNIIFVILHTKNAKEREEILESEGETLEGLHD
jgi:hypothetical protein